MSQAIAGAMLEQHIILFFGQTKGYSSSWWCTGYVRPTFVLAKTVGEIANFEVGSQIPAPFKVSGLRRRLVIQSFWQLLHVGTAVLPAVR